MLVCQDQSTTVEVSVITGSGVLLGGVCVNEGHVLLCTLFIAARHKDTVSSGKGLSRHCIAEAGSCQPHFRCILCTALAYTNGCGCG